MTADQGDAELGIFDFLDPDGDVLNVRTVGGDNYVALCSVNAGPFVGLSVSSARQLAEVLTRAADAREAAEKGETPSALVTGDAVLAERILRLARTGRLRGLGALL